MLLQGASRARVESEELLGRQGDVGRVQNGLGASIISIQRQASHRQGLVTRLDGVRCRYCCHGVLLDLISHDLRTSAWIGCTKAKLRSHDGVLKVVLGLCSLGLDYFQMLPLFSLYLLRSFTWTNTHREFDTGCNNLYFTS